VLWWWDKTFLTFPIQYIERLGKFFYNYIFLAFRLFAKKLLVLSKNISVLNYLCKNNSLNLAFNYKSKTNKHLLMRTTEIITRKCSKLGLFLTASVLILISCSPKLAVHKPLTFTDVEKEFHFAKPLPENSKQVILKQFGSVQNYHDSIVARRNNPHYKNIVISANPISFDSVERKVFYLTDEELKSKGIKVSRDSILNHSKPALKK
jgi:hypothetical protein